MHLMFVMAMKKRMPSLVERNNSEGHVVKEKVAHWKQKAGSKQNKAKSNRPFNCWNCGDPDHSARSCPQPRSEDCARLLRESKSRNREYRKSSNEEDDQKYSDEDQQSSPKRGRDNIYGPDGEERRNH